MKISIRIKFFYGLMIVFLAAYIFSIIAVSQTIQSYNYQIINREMKSHSSNMNLYIKQYIKTNELEWDSSTYSRSVENFGNILSSKYNERLIIYDDKGEFLFDSIDKDGKTDFDDEKEDVFLALKDNNSAFTLIRSKDSYMVVLSIPMKNYKSERGVVRFINDYSFMLKKSRALYGVIMMSLMVVFIALFFFIWILSKVITRPLFRLNEASKKIAQGEFDCEIKLNTGDEIEELSNTLNFMKDEIEKQIIELETERDNLKRVHKHRKLFFDNITHDMKTPLTIISGYIQILQDEGLDDKEFAKVKLNNIKNQAEKLHRLILGLLEEAKSESEMEYTFTSFDISRMINSTVKNMEVASRKKNISIKSCIEEKLTVFGDEFRLNQVVVNIIDNSIKYSHENTMIEVILYREKNRCIVEIIDEGVGIPEEYINRVFDPYYSMIDEKKNSTGLGLYIANVIIKKHMGEISIDSMVGQGTHVFIKIPFEGNRIS